MAAGPSVNRESQRLDERIESHRVLRTPFDDCRWIREWKGSGGIEMAAGSSLNQKNGSGWIRTSLIMGRVGILTDYS